MFSFLSGLIIFQATLKTGLLNSLTTSTTPKLILSDLSRVPINERFNLGGPLNLRGYSINGVGPHDSFAALGGNAYWVYGAHIYTPLPFAKHIKDIVRAHVFFNSGSIESIDLRNENNLVAALSNNVRKSVGVGIVVAFNSVRLELNYAYPNPWTGWKWSRSSRCWYPVWNRGNFHVENGKKRKMKKVVECIKIY